MCRKVKARAIPSGNTGSPEPVLGEFVMPNIISCSKDRIKSKL